MGNRNVSEKKLIFLDAHCQQQWASLGVEFSGKKRTENEKLMGDHGRSMGGHVRSVGVMGGQWGVLRGQWGVMGGQWVVLGGQWEVKGGSRQVTRRLQNAHCQRYSRAEALPVIFWLRYLSKIWVQWRPKKCVFATKWISRQKRVFVPLKHGEENFLQHLMLQ